MAEASHNSRLETFCNGVFAIALMLLIIDIKIPPFALYTICAITAFWFPLAIAMITIITWIFWLIHGISIKHLEVG